VPISFATKLEQYLLLAREQGFDLLGIQSSYAGALGIPQFNAQQLPPLCR